MFKQQKKLYDFNKHLFTIIIIPFLYKLILWSVNEIKTVRLNPYITYFNVNDYFKMHHLFL